MPTAKTTPPADRAQHSTRPSLAIQDGADQLLALVNDERTKLTRLYHDNLKNLEMDFRTRFEAEIISAKSREKLHLQKIESLSAQLHDSQKDAESNKQESRRLREENEALKAALNGAGMVYADGGIHFKDEIARVVDDFVNGARMQEKAMSMLGSKHHSPLPDDGDSSPRPVEPSEFFVILSGVLEKGRRFAEDLKRQQSGDISSFTQDIAVGQESQSAVDRKDSALQNPVIEDTPSQVLSPTQTSYHSPASPTNKRPAAFPSPSIPPAKQQKVT